MSPTIPARLLDQLLNPTEAPLPAESGLRSIAVTYPRREIRVLGWDWLGLYFLPSFGFRLALRRPFGVVI